MPSYKAPVADTLFLLNDVFDYQRYNNLPGFADAPPDLLEAVLGEAAKFCEGVLTPLNRAGVIPHHDAEIALDEAGAGHGVIGGLGGARPVDDGQRKGISFQRRSRDAR